MIEEKKLLDGLFVYRCHKFVSEWSKAGLDARDLRHRLTREIEIKLS